jgi:hypothetical protein
MTDHGYAERLDTAWDRFLDDPDADVDLDDGGLMRDLHALGDRLDDPVSTPVRVPTRAVPTGFPALANQPWRIRRQLSWSNSFHIAATIAIIFVLASATVATLGRDWVQDQWATGAEGDRTLDPGQEQIMHIAVPGQSKVLAIGLWKLDLPAHAFVEFDDAVTTLGDRPVAVWVQQGRIDTRWEQAVRQLGPGMNTAIGGGGNSITTVEPVTVLVVAPMIPVHERPFAVGGGGQIELLATAPYDDSAGSASVTVDHVVADEGHALPQSTGNVVGAIHVESGTISVTSTGTMESPQEIATGETLTPGEGETITEIRGVGSGSATAFVISTGREESADALPAFYDTTATLSVTRPSEIRLTTRRMTLEPGTSWVAEGDAAEVILVESGSPQVSGSDDIEYVLSEGSQIARNPGQSLEVRNLTVQPIVLISGIATLTSPESRSIATPAIPIVEGSSTTSSVPAGTYNLSLSRDTLDSVNGLAIGRQDFTGLANIDVLEGYGTVDLNDADGPSTPAAIHEIDAASSFGAASSIGRGGYWIEADPETGMRVLLLELLLAEGDSGG